MPPLRDWLSPTALSAIATALMSAAMLLLRRGVGPQAEGDSSAAQREAGHSSVTPSAATARYAIGAQTARSEGRHARVKRAPAVSGNVDISDTVGDPSRERVRFGEWCPSKRLLRAVRDYQRHRHQRWPWHLVLRKVAVLRHHFWSAVCGAEVPLNAQIGIGLVMPHPNGIVIHPGAIIGPNCMIFQQVTLGTSRGDGVPCVAGHVDIHAGAKVLGKVRIGAHAVVGANAVVLRDVPPRALAVGAPARWMLHQDRPYHRPMA